MVDVARESRSGQTELWNGPAGRAWVDAQEWLDRAFKPFEDLLVDEVTKESPRAVLDVGCGTGGTILAVARRVEVASCTGIDLSEPMIAAARARAEREATPARFICANAELHAFDPAAFDMIISRFGVMFFDDPVRAFTNLRRAATAAAALRFVVWRSPDENPFMTAAERAAAPLLPDLQARQPEAPGQFAFANRERVRTILAASGWAGIEIRPFDIECALSEGALGNYLARFGPVGRALQDADDQTRARIADAVRPAFDRYLRGAEVRFTAACWMASAHAGA
jgi:SAM-dependent methyltransferase